MVTPDCPCSLPYAHLRWRHGAVYDDANGNGRSCGKQTACAQNNVSDGPSTIQYAVQIQLQLIRLAAWQAALAVAGGVKVVGVVKAKVETRSLVSRSSHRPMKVPKA